MNHKLKKQKLVLAIDPTSRGFGYALFEGSLSPINWGVKEARVPNDLKNARYLKMIDELIDFYGPEVIVIEKHSNEVSRRCKRVQRLLSGICSLGKKRKVALRSYSRQEINDYFSSYGAKTKYKIALTIANWLPEFEPRLPNFRKAWMSEDYRMAIFNSVSLILTFYYLDKKRSEI